MNRMKDAGRGIGRKDEEWGEDCVDLGGRGRGRVRGSGRNN